MKILNAILFILLIGAIFMIFKLKKEQHKHPETHVHEPPADTLTQPEVVILFHLDDPVSALQRYYNLFDGSVISSIDIGNNVPKGPIANRITKELGVPLTSGKDPFPFTLLDSLIAANYDGNFLHFSNINIGSSSLGFGSKETTPCPFPQINPTTDPPMYGQVIPWVKFPDSALPYFNKAQKVGFEACDTFITDRKEGYVIDPQGILMLLQGD